MKINQFSIVCTKILNNRKIVLDTKIIIIFLHNKKILREIYKAEIRRNVSSQRKK